MCISTPTRMRGRSSFCAALATATVSTATRVTPDRVRMDVHDYVVATVDICDGDPSCRLAQCRRYRLHELVARPRRSTTWCAPTDCRRRTAAKRVSQRRQTSALASLARRDQLAPRPRTSATRWGLPPLHIVGIFGATLHTIFTAHARARSQIGTRSKRAAGRYNERA